MINITGPTFNEMRFECLSLGDTFINCEGQLCMKIKPPGSCYSNVVVLENGHTYWIDEGADVAPVECALTYNYK